MKIKKIILENFRCYKEKTEIKFDDLTVFVGKNDIGKSTILEAIDIFFETERSIKISSEDCNVEKTDQDIKIGIIFNDLPDKVILDSDYETSLKEEPLLNKDGDLEIHKTYKNGKINGTFIKSYYPTDEKLKDLYTLKIEDLKTKANALEVDKDNYKGNICSSIRKAIINKINDKNYEEILFPIEDKTQKELKQLYLKIKESFPDYFLFRSDRLNSEKDSEIQDPVQLVLSEVLDTDSIKQQLEEIKNKVCTEINNITPNIIEKLSETNIELANSLKLKDFLPKWNAAFKEFNFFDNNGIPISKRGSGVRRLVLFSFLRYEAEKNIKDEKDNSIVYAIEEPETSQHSDYQELLIKSLIQLSEKQQIIITTHSAQLCKLVPIDSLRLIKRISNTIEVQNGSDNDEVLREISDEVGIIQYLKNIIICVEGATDAMFLYTINKNITEFTNIIDLTKENISILPLHGSNLVEWVKKNYLKNNVLEFHLYDNDVEEYKKCANDINNRKDGNCATITQSHEIENYIHYSLIEPEFNITFDPDQKNDWKNQDVTEIILNRSEKYKQATKEGKEKSSCEKEIKNIICGKLSQKMTKDLFDDLKVFEEVSSWFKKIKEMYNKN